MAKLFVLLKIKDASGIGWLQSYAGYGAYTVLATVTALTA